MLAVPAMLFTACSEEEASYEPTPATSGMQAYFSNEDSRDILLADGQNSITYNIYRVDDSKDATVAITKTTNDNIFNVPSTVSFKAGEKTAPLTVTFDFNHFKQNADQAFNLGLAIDESITPYGDSAVTLGVKYAPWTEWYGSLADWKAAGYEAADWPLSSTAKTAVYSYNLYWAGDDKQPIYFRQSLLNPAECQFNISNWGGGIDFIINGTYNAATGLYDLQVPETDINDPHPSYGTVWVADMPHYQEGLSYDNYPCTYDPKTGTFSLYLIYYVSAGYFGHGVEVNLVDGFIRKDFSMSMAYAGGYINGADAGAIVNFVKGADVASYRYVVCPGFLSEDEIDEIGDKIFNDEIECKSSSENGPKLFSLQEDGDYTVVVASYDAESAFQKVSAFSFTYKYVGGAEEVWTPAYIGTFTYTVFFNEEEDVPLDDPGLTLSVSDQNEYRFKISHVFYDVDFIFEMDPETGALSYEDQFTGYTHPTYGDVMVGEMRNYYADAEDYVGSFSNGKFKFYNVYFVDAGSFGYGIETFTLTANAVKDYVTVPQKKDFTPVAWKLKSTTKKASKPASVLNVKSKNITFKQMHDNLRPKAL